MDNILELKGLSKKFNHYFHLEIKELAISKGEKFVLLGPSGAGKSTLLRMMHGVEEASEGEVIFSGNKFVYGNMVSARRQMSMVFQRPEFFNNSIEFNLEYPLRIRKLEIREQVQEMLDLVSLPVDPKKTIRDISGGELQRVAIARALITKPKVLFLDEPTSNLDPYNVKLIESIIRDVNGQGTTIVLVTHDPYQAKRIADKVALILDGKIIEIGSKEKFFSNPKDERALRFINGELL
jgi:tungstate transport system ATP-binding protein